MKMVFTEEEQAFVNAFNAKIELWRVLADLFANNLLGTSGISFKNDLEVYIKANQDRWVELQLTNNN